MSLLEISANLLTLLSVFLSVRLKVSLYPVGLVATALFMVVFWQAKLYASAALQVYFIGLQLYGWWFWLRGAQGRKPTVADWSWTTVALMGLGGLLITLPLSWAIHRYTDAQAPRLDTAILALSVLAQFLLDRKQLKTWIVWGVVDVVSIYVYASQGLWVTSAVYSVLLINVFFGWWSWRRAYVESQAAGQPA